MKKLSVVLILIMALSMLISCGGSGKEMDADSFAEGLDLYGDNLKIRLTENYAGERFTAEIIVTEDETFFSSMNDSYWYITVGDQYLNILASAGNSFSSFEYSDGKYTADSFVYTEDGYEYEILNVKIDFDSKGRVSSFCYEEYEEDGNRVLELKMSAYGSAKAPDEELVVRDDGPTVGPSYPDNPGSAEMPEDDPDAGNARDDSNEETQTALTEEEWTNTFTRLSVESYTATVNLYTPGKSENYDFRSVDGTAYYCYYVDHPNNNWSVGTIDDFLTSVMPFAALYADFEFDGKTYFCSVSSLDFGEGVEVIDVYVRFDELGRLVELSYTLVHNDEYGNMKLSITSYGETVAPEVSSGADNGDNGNMSKDEYAPDAAPDAAPDTEQNNAADNGGGNNNATD